MPTNDNLKACEKIFNNPDRQSWNPYCTLYELSERSLLKYKGDITQVNYQEHHLLDHDMDDVNIVSISATAYKHHIDNSTASAYCAIVYKMPSKTDCEFVSAINQRAEILKMMV